MPDLSIRAGWTALRRRLRPVRRSARALRRRAVQAGLPTGDRVQCPCCGNSFRSFLRQPPSNRPNACCRVCGSLERHRMLWLYLTEVRPDLLDGPRRLLHFAPEPIFQRLLQAKPNIEYVSADIDSPLAEHQLDIHDLPFPDASFDALLCIHVLEHVEDDRRAMHELRRVLKGGGWAIIMVPLHGGMLETLEDPAVDTPQERLRAYGQADHLRLYGRDYPDRLRQAGFDVEVQDCVEVLGRDAYTRFVLSPEKVYLCSAPESSRAR